MTKPSRQRSSVARWLLIGMMGWFVACIQINESHEQDKIMTTEQLTLWQTIEALAQQVPFTKVKVEILLSATLSETDNSGNDVFQFFKSNRIALKEGVEIVNVDLRIKRNGSHPGFMVLEIGGACITLEGVRSHYGTLKITDTPRGRSMDESTSHSAYLPWGKLSFGFNERNPECLASIAFDPQKDH